MVPKKPLILCILQCGCSTFLIVCGVVLLFIWPSIHEYVLSSNMILKNKSQTYDMWKINPVPLTLKIYLFNWTNAYDFNNSTVKPRFQQIGPFTYDEIKEKANVTWNKNGTVSFRNRKTFYFNEKESKGNLNDIVLSVNPTALAAAYSARDWNIILKKSVSVLVADVIATHTAGEVLFDGYRDGFIDMAHKLPPMLIEAPPFDKFGWFYGRNGSEEYEGSYNMGTGENGDLGELYEWKFMNHTPYYRESCGKVTGSAGEFFPRNLNKNTIIKFFNADLCRYVVMDFVEEVVVDGILGYKYSAGERFLDNGTLYPENKCFCDGDCMPSGALNASACRYGSPAFVSLPHFYGADPYYLDLLEGLQPNKGKHEFFIIFEPTTAIPLKVSAKLQLNLLLQPIQDIRKFEQVPTVYVPVLWFEQVVSLPENILFSLKLLLNFETMCIAISAILIFLGLLLQLCLCYKHCTYRLFKKRGQESSKITKEEVPLKSSI